MSGPVWPEVGKYHCYLGSQKTSQPRSYFTDPIFIYQQSVIILVQLANLGLLLHTGIIIRSASNISRERGRAQFLRFVKIFCILGFTWIAELISTALEVEHGYQAEWSSLIGPDTPDTVISLVEPYYAGAKVYVMIGGFHARKGPIIGVLMP